MKWIGIVTATAVVACAPAIEASSTPTADELIEQMRNACTVSAATQTTYLTYSMRQEEVTVGGTSNNIRVEALVSMPELDRVRLQLDPQVVLVNTPDSAWAIVSGELDKRPSTPAMAKKTVQQSLLPLLVPFSLGLPGVTVGPPTTATFGDRPAWRLTLEFVPDFFAVPTLQADWTLYVDRTSGLPLGLETMPEEQYRTVAAEGMRYRYLDFADVSGYRLPHRVILEGIDLATGRPTAHVAQITITYRAADPARGDFIHPEKLKAIEEGGAVGAP